MDYNEKEFLWVEKYRPQTIDDCVLPARIKSYFDELKNKKEIQNMILAGSPGTGKTTIAKALCNELNIDVLMINASENGDINTLRTIIRSFASTMSFSGNIKCVILDEADYLTSATQPALRGFIEEFSNNCRFILTANFANKIIEPLKSRCVVIDFTYNKTEKKELIVEYDKRIKEILENEKIVYDKKTLAQIIIRHFPDFRKIINEIQHFSQSGELNSEVIKHLHETDINVLVQYLKDKDFGNMRKWVADNMDNDFHVIQRALYDRMYELIEPKSIPELVMILASYDYKNAFVIDKEINLVAMLTEIMGTVNFK